MAENVDFATGTLTVTGQISTSTNAINLIQTLDNTSSSAVAASVATASPFTKTLRITGTFSV